MSGSDGAFGPFAKVPVHPQQRDGEDIDARLSVRLPDWMIARAETVRFRREWAEVLDGLQARLGYFGGVNDDAWATIEFRLTPPDAP
jgi:hypothetical protein